MDINDNNKKFTLSHFWYLPYYVPTNDGYVITSDKLKNLFKNWIDNEVIYIENDEIKQRMPLKQTGYKVDCKFQPWLICGKGEKAKHLNCAFLKHIKIEILDGSLKKSLLYSKDVVSLPEYIKTKMDLVEDVFERLNRQNNDELAPIEQTLTSEAVSQILSCNFRIGNNLSLIGGNRHIFESDELLDQLVILALIKSAREGFAPSINLLLGLLKSGVERFVKKLFTKYRYAHIEGVMDDFVKEAMVKAYQIVVNDKNLADGYKYNLKNIASLKFFLLGKEVINFQQGGFIPKLQEYFRDKYKKNNKINILSSEKSISNEKPDKYNDYTGKEDEDEDEEIGLKTTQNIYAGSLEMNSNFKAIYNSWTKRNQEIFDLRIYKDKTFEDIGIIYNLDKSAVYKIISKQIAQLRKALF